MNKIFTVIAVAFFSISLFSFNSFAGEHEEMKDEMKTEEMAPVGEMKEETGEEVKPAEETMDENMMQEEVSAQPEVQEMDTEAGAEVEVQAGEMVVEPEPEPVFEVLGTVSRIAENSIAIMNERDNKEYSLFSDNPEMLQNIEPGYRVEAYYTGDKLVNLIILGVPVEAEPTIIKLK